MQIVKTPSEMQAISHSLRREGKRIGFVPTMGFLHDGHLSLMREARNSSDIVVVSIFVNPTQFAPGEDLDKYPRDFERDESLCRDEGVDILFYPTPENMYLPDHSVNLSEDVLSCSLCGSSRPGHFQGVLTVVAKLFNIVMPDLAVFGQKDAQQLRLIQKMVSDLNFPVDIIPAPIVREPDGLAMSSRNSYLSPEERSRALCLKGALDRARELIDDGVRDVSLVREEMTGIIDSSSGETDYIEIVDYETLKPIDSIKGKVLIALAVKLGKTRLIDNAVVESLSS